VSHTGSVVLRLIADNTGLTAGLSRAVTRRGSAPVRNRGRVVTDLAVCIADGARVLSDLAALRVQAELYGQSRRTRPRGAPSMGSASGSGPGSPRPWAQNHFAQLDRRAHEALDAKLNPFGLNPVELYAYLENPALRRYDLTLRDDVDMLRGELARWFR